MHRSRLTVAAVLALSGACTEPWLKDLADPDDTYPPPCEKVGIHACRKACNDDDAAACLALAHAYFIGHAPLERDPKRSV